MKNSNFARSKFRYDTFLFMNIKGADQTERMQGVLESKTKYFLKYECYLVNCSFLGITHITVIVSYGRAPVVH